MTATILSLQSWVAYGHVGNAAAMFPLQRLGAEVWGVHTVQFSNHAGYGAWGGRVFDAEAIAEVVAGIAARGVLASCDAVLSGYLGDAAIGDAVLAAAARVKAANPRALWCCDPVIGDVGRGVYVRAGVAAFFAERALPRADLITPNHFELEHLTGCRVVTLSDAKAAVAVLHDRGPRGVLVTSLRTEATPDDAIDLLASADGGFFLLRTPKLDLAAKGTGDAIAALFLLHWLRTRDAARGLSESASALFGVLRRTAEARAPEMLLIAAQEELVTPSRRFAAQAV